MTYTLIDSVTLGSSASSVTFSSISQDYGDLVLVGNAQTSSGTGFMRLQFNGDTTAGNYLYVDMNGNGSTTSSSNSGSSQVSFPIGAYTSTPGTGIAQIMDYSSTNKHKALLARLDLATLRTQAFAGRWASTAAINSVTILLTTAAIAGSTFHLYGIAK